MTASSGASAARSAALVCARVLMRCISGGAAGGAAGISWGVPGPFLVAPFPFLLGAQRVQVAGAQRPGALLAEGVQQGLVAAPGVGTAEPQAVRPARPCRYPKSGLLGQVAAKACAGVAGQAAGGAGLVRAAVETAAGCWGPVGVHLPCRAS